MDEHQHICKTPACKNNLMYNRVYEISKKKSKGESEGSRIQFQLEEEPINVKGDLTASYGRNFIL